MGRSPRQRRPEERESPWSRSLAFLRSQLPSASAASGYLIVLLPGSGRSLCKCQKTKGADSMTWTESGHRSPQSGLQSSPVPLFPPFPPVLFLTSSTSCSGTGMVAHCVSLTAEAAGTCWPGPRSSVRVGVCGPCLCSTAGLLCRGAQLPGVMAGGEGVLPRGCVCQPGSRGLVADVAAVAPLTARVPQSCPLCRRGHKSDSEREKGLEREPQQGAGRPPWPGAGLAAHTRPSRRLLAEEGVATLVAAYAS